MKTFDHAFGIVLTGLALTVSVPAPPASAHDFTKARLGGVERRAPLPETVAINFSPFVALSGSWSGAGTITMASGSNERIRCRARYDVHGSGSNLDLILRCASDSFNFDLQSNVAQSKGAVSGTWAELTRHVGGTIEGSANGNRIQARVSGTLSAMLVMSTQANQQSISIEAPGSEMSFVAISLSRISR